jgi:hypothetical protein
VKRYTVLFVFILYAGILLADFIIPQTDPVYPFLEMAHTRQLTSMNLIQYPLYYLDVINSLSDIQNSSDASQFFREQANFHHKRLYMNYQKQLDIAVFPISRIPDSVSSLFRWDPTPHRLVTMTDPQRDESNETHIYASGILGFGYDVRRQNSRDRYRVHEYYGVEAAGNFTPDFGFYIKFNKGHYTGNAGFIAENPFISKFDGELRGDDGTYYILDMTSEIDFKNRYINLSMGYGTFDIGRTITSSVILNRHVNPYGYLKFNKKFKQLEYTGITAQLTPDSLTTTNQFDTKSMAIQTIVLNTEKISFGVGNTIIYGDRSFDIAYATPLALYKVMDNKKHARDNGLFFIFADIRPSAGINLYANILYDDIKNSRFTTSKWMSYSAYQAGVLYQFENIPLEIGVEGTAVGPSTYGHKSRTLTYIHDGQMLGPSHGSNFLSLATRARIHLSRFSISLLYENVQQGDIAHHPQNYDYHEQKFLANNIRRSELFNTRVDFRIIPELRFFSSYEYRKSENKTRNSILTGMEFVY